MRKNCTAQVSEDQSKS